MSGIFAFNPIPRRLSNAVAELETRCPCKSLMQRLCCRETSDRNGFDARGGHNRKSIIDAKIRKNVIFARTTSLVMPALVAGIHVFMVRAKPENVDGRNKSGHDGGRCQNGFMNVSGTGV